MFNWRTLWICDTNSVKFCWKIQPWFIPRWRFTVDNARLYQFELHIERILGFLNVGQKRCDLVNLPRPHNTQWNPTNITMKFHEDIQLRRPNAPQNEAVAEWKIEGIVLFFDRLKAIRNRSILIVRSSRLRGSIALHLNFRLVQRRAPCDQYRPR